MKSFVLSILAQLSKLVASASPFAKAITPAALALAVSLVNMGFAGRFDVTSIVTLASGLLASILTYVVPNGQSKPVSASSAPPQGK